MEFKAGVTHYIQKFTVAERLEEREEGGKTESERERRKKAGRKEKIIQAT